MSTFSLLLLSTLVVGSAWALTPQNPPFGQLSVSGSNLVDASGKPVQLRGMSLFWSQWMPQYWTKEVVTTLKCKWNANVVRAAMAVDQGGYLSNKQAELTKVRTIVEAAIEAGIYVIIDWHIHEAQSAKAEAIAFFKQMATDYGKYPHVIYEIWNEPLQVDWNSVLKPYHTDLLAAIRPIDAKNIVLLGTPAWSGASGIQAANASPLTGQKNIMYVQHFYSGSHKDADRSALQTASIPIFVSEYGISEADGGSNGQIYTDEANKWFDLMDQKKVSYVNWAIDDKTESSAALLPGTQSSQLGDDSKLSPSGKFIKAMLIARNPKAICDGSSSPPSPPSGPPPPPPSVPSPPPSSPPSPPSSGAGGVSVNVKVTNQWQGGAQLDVNIVNNGDAKVCGATVKIAKDSATVVQNAWNLDGGPDLYSTPSYVSLSKGQTHTGGMVVQGKVPTFTVSSTKAC